MASQQQSLTWVRCTYGGWVGGLQGALQLLSSAGAGKCPIGESACLCCQQEQSATRPPSLQVWEVGLLPLLLWPKGISLPMLLHPPRTMANTFYLHRASTSSASCIFPTVRPAITMYRLEIIEFEQIPCLFKLTQHFLTYWSVGAGTFFSSRLIFGDWPRLRPLLANHAYGSHDLREPSTFSMKP